MHKLKQNNIFYAGVILFLIFIIIALLAPIISPYDPNELGYLAYSEPSYKHFLGTNDIGQDIFSELIYGTRVSLIIGISSAISVTILGTIVGIISGYYKGYVDNILNFIINVMLSVPSLPLIILLGTVLKAGFWGIVITISLTSWPYTARIIRTRVMEISELPFIKIEENLGQSHVKIMFYHIFVNIIDIILIRGAMSVGMAMMMETSLSFLGLGSYTQKSWGNIIHFAFFRNGVINGYWWWYLPPIACISLCVLAFNFLTYYKKK